MFLSEEKHVRNRSKSKLIGVIKLSCLNVRNVLHFNQRISASSESLETLGPCRQPWRKSLSDPLFASVPDKHAC